MRASPRRCAVELLMTAPPRSGGREEGSAELSGTVRPKSICGSKIRRRCERLTAGRRAASRPIDALRQDSVTRCRTRRSPGLRRLLCSGIMSVRIGANTAVFSVLNALVLKPLPYREPRRTSPCRTSSKIPRLNALAKQFSFPCPIFRPGTTIAPSSMRWAYYGTHGVVHGGTRAE